MYWRRARRRTSSTLLFHCWRFEPKSGTSRAFTHTRMGVEFKWECFKMQHVYQKTHSCGGSLSPSGSAWRLTPLTTHPWVTIIMCITAGGIMPSNASCVGQNAAVLGVPNRALRCVKQSLVPAYISMFIIIILIMIMIIIILCIIHNIFRHRSSPYKPNH